MTAGETMDEASTGGEVLILAGEGSSTYSIDGGNGGSGTSALLIHLFSLFHIVFECLYTSYSSSASRGFSGW